MTEASGAHLMIAALSSALLALLGVDYYALLWGFIGSGFSALYADPMGRWRAIATVVGSAFVGAAFGSLVSGATESRAFLIFASSIGGAGARPIVGAGIQRAVRVVRGAKGEPPETPPPAV